MKIKTKKTVEVEREISFPYYAASSLAAYKVINESLTMAVYYAGDSVDISVYQIIPDSVFFVLNFLYFLYRFPL